MTTVDLQTPDDETRPQPPGAADPNGLEVMDNEGPVPAGTEAVRHEAEWPQAFPQAALPIPVLPEAGPETAPVRARPVIRDDRRHQAKRGEGVSKKKAGRFANSPATKVRRGGGKVPRYEEWTKQELYARAKQAGIGGRSTMSKQELITALRHR